MLVNVILQAICVFLSPRPLSEMCERFIWNIHTQRKKIQISSLHNIYLYSGLKVGGVRAHKGLLRPVCLVSLQVLLRLSQKETVSSSMGLDLLASRKCQKGNSLKMCFLLSNIQTVSVYSVITFFINIAALMIKTHDFQIQFKKQDF